MLTGMNIGPMSNVAIRMPLLPGQIGNLPGPSPDSSQVMVQGPGGPGGPGLSPFSSTTTTTSQFSANNGGKLRILNLLLIPFCLSVYLQFEYVILTGLMPPQGPQFPDILKRQHPGAPGANNIVPNSTPNTQAPSLGFNNIQAQQQNQQSAAQAQLLSQGPQSQPLPSPQFSSPPPGSQPNSRLTMPPTPTSQDGHIPNASMLVSSSPSPGLTPTSNGLPGAGPQVAAATSVSLSSQQSLPGLGLMSSTTVTAPNSVPTPGSTVSTSGKILHLALYVLILFHNCYNLMMLN